jgi:hypothetical protein
MGWMTLGSIPEGPLEAHKTSYYTCKVKQTKVRPGRVYENPEKE